MNRGARLASPRLPSPRFVATMLAAPCFIASALLATQDGAAQDDASQDVASKDVASKDVASITAPNDAIASQDGVASPDDAAPPISRAARGTTGSFEIASAQPIRAKATSDLTAPILVRAAEIAPGRHRIEYMGLVSGTYDLAAYLERIDGRAAAFDAPIRVEVFTQLPPNHGTDVFGISAPSFGLSARYRELLVALGAAWLLVPAIVIGVRIARRRPEPAPAPAPRVPTLADRLFEIVDGARSRELSTDELGRLELLLLRILREHAAASGGGSGEGSPAASPAALAAATEALRADPTHGPAVRAVERWLHARDEGEARAALAAIDALRGVATEAVR